MGIKKTLARRGAVGSTARWAAKGYLSYVSSNPEASVLDVLRFLVAARYGDVPNGMESLIFELLDKDEIRGLLRLVLLVLSVEAGYTANTEKNKALFSDVIGEELESLSVPYDFIVRPRTY